VVANDMSMTVTLPDGSTQPIPFVGMAPPIVQRLRSTIRGPREDGLVPARIESLDAYLQGEAAPEVAAGLERALANLRGLTFDLLFNVEENRPTGIEAVGGAKTSELDLVQNLATQVSEQMTSFPMDPIGVGAQWRYTVALDIYGLKFDTAATVTVTKVSRKALDFDVVTTMAPAGGQLQVPGIPADARVELLSFDSTGTATQHVDLRTLITEGSQRSSVTMKMQVYSGEVPGAQLTMHLGNTIDTHLAK
jgi:hypothetical protein